MGAYLEGQSTLRGIHVKRYLFSILFALFAVGGVGIGYIYSSIDHLPKYKLATIQGNPSEGRAIELTGHYLPIMFSDALTVNAEGSRYNYKQNNFRSNVLDSRYWFLDDVNVQQLITENRQFMRGKVDRGGLYNDEKWLIYADNTRYEQSGDSKSEVALYVSVLNKKLNKIDEYEFELNGENNLYYIVSDVQLIEDQIHILVTKAFIDGAPDHLFDYIVDLSSGLLKSSNPLIVNDSDSVNDPKEDIVHHLSTLTDSKSIAPSDYILITEHVEKVTSRDNENSYASQLIKTKYYSYSYKTGEILQLPVTGGGISIPIFADNVLTKVVFYEKEITVTSYNLVTEEFKSNEPVITAGSLGVTSIENSILEDNRLYVLSERGSTPVAATIDISTGEVLYIGEVVYDGPDSEAKDAMEKLHLMNIRINR